MRPNLAAISAILLFAVHLSWGCRILQVEYAGDLARILTTCRGKWICNVFTEGGDFFMGLRYEQPTAEIRSSLLSQCFSVQTIPEDGADSELINYCKPQIIPSSVPRDKEQFAAHPFLDTSDAWTIRERIKKLGRNGEPIQVVIRNSSLVLGEIVVIPSHIFDWGKRSTANYVFGMFSASSLSVEYVFEFFTISRVVSAVKYLVGHLKTMGGSIRILSSSDSLSFDSISPRIAFTHRSLRRIFELAGVDNIQHPCASSTNSISIEGTVSRVPSLVDLREKALQVLVVDPSNADAIVARWGHQSVHVNRLIRAARLVKNIEDERILLEGAIILSPGCCLFPTDRFDIYELADEYFDRVVSAEDRDVREDNLKLLGAISNQAVFSRTDTLVDIHTSEAGGGVVRVSITNHDDSDLLCIFVGHFMALKCLQRTSVLQGEYLFDMRKHIGPMHVQLFKNRQPVSLIKHPLHKPLSRPRLCAFTLNARGVPFLRHHINVFQLLFAQLNIDWEWHLVHESKTHGDGTAEFIEMLGEVYPDRIRVYSQQVWHTQREMKNAAIREMKSSCILVHITRQDMWKTSQFASAIKLFDSSPKKHCAYIESLNDAPREHDEAIRLWRFRPPMFWSTNTGLSKYNGSSWEVLKGSNHCFSQEQTRSSGVVFSKTGPNVSLEGRILGTKKKRILVDGVIFQLQRHGGISKVWHELLPRLANSGYEIVLLVRCCASSQVVQDIINKSSGGIQIILAPPYVAHDENQLDSSEEMLSSISKLTRSGYFFSTAYTRCPGIANFLMIHDMIPEEFGWDLQLPEWKAKHRALKMARAIFAVSNATREQLHSYRNVLLTPLAIDTKVFSPTKVDNNMRPYWLIVGPRHGYKGAYIFFHALAHLSLPHPPDVKLVGGPPLTKGELELIPDHINIDHLQNLHSDNQLAAIYTGATALIYLSIREGFGFPVAEAMACGCPVVLLRENKASLQVASEQVAFVVDKPTDPSHVARVLESLLGNPRLVAAKRQLGINRIRKHFASWDDALDTIRAALLDHKLL